MMAPHWGLEQLIDIDGDQARNDLARISVTAMSFVAQSARGLGLPYTGVAVDGARAADVVARQLGAVEAQAGGDWDLGCLYVGVNDVRALDFDAAAFARAGGRS